MEILILLAMLYFWFRARGRVSARARKVLGPGLVRDIEAVAARVGVPANIVGAIVAVESGGYPLAVGSVGERGLMQITRAALDDVNRRYGLDLKWEEMFAEIPNLYAGSYYLKLQHERLADWEDAIRAYNAGERGARIGLGVEYLNKVKRWL